MNRLLICSPAHTLRGGVETVIHDLCRALPALGWDVLLGLGRGARFNDPERYRREYPELPIVEIDGTGGTRQARLEGVIRVIRKTRPDVVLSARLFDAWVAAARLKEHGKAPRLAVAIRSCDPGYLYDARRYGGIIDLGCVDGELLRRMAVRWSGLDPAKVANLPGGVRPATGTPVPRHARAPLRLAYVGRLSQADKRVLDLPELCARLAGDGVAFSLRVVGSGPDEALLRGRLDPFVERGVVSFVPWTDSAELYRTVYPELDVALLFSPAEGVTIACREAMVHGAIPVMAEFLGMHAEGLYRPGRNCLVFPVGDIASAATCVRRLTAESGLMERLSAEAMAAQTGRHLFDGAIRAWAEAFDRCMERAPATGQAPPLDYGNEGRLSRLGLSPRLAQRVRDGLRIRPVHSTAGGEWPHESGRMPAETAREILNLAAAIEAEARQAWHGSDGVSLKPEERELA